MGWAVGWEFLQRMSGKWGPVRKHRGGTVGSATATTAANGGNRELQLGPRPARRKRMRRGCWVPQPVAVRGETPSPQPLVSGNFIRCYCGSVI